MEEELQKRNTDCVYFLASPLTCKKGLDCEYRHSEIARLNPRDCWYWLAGNCLNSSCGFRHPPLDVHAEASSESAPLSLHVNKTSIPCYFYLNGFCNKGDRCSFLHGPDGSAPSGKSLKIDALPLENKTSSGNDSLSAPTGTHQKPSETTPKPTMDVTVQPLEDLQQSASISILKQSVSPHMSGDDCEEAAVIKSDSLLPAEGFIQSRSQVCTDQSSEEEMDDCIEPEERWESSPGFDVLVDNKSEKFCYEDEPECLLALDRKRREDFLGYDFDDPVEFDPMYPDAELLYERKMYDASNQLDNKLIFYDVGRVSGKSREEVSDTIMSRKRKKFLPIGLEVDDRNGMDLRDHLRKHRVIDGCPIIRLSRMHESCCLIDSNWERPQRHGSRRRSGRLPSEVGKNSIESFGGNGTLSNGARQHGWLSHSQSNLSRQCYKEKRLAKRQCQSSEFSSKPVSRERRSALASATFTGPKTLAQIKEEKKRDEGHWECFGKMGYSSRTTSSDFQGPKPLSQILRDKRRLGTVMDGNTSGS